MEKKIMVSIYIATYNHVGYIRQALDSVVNQKTKFKYEIIVHDDASVDGTQEIILEYQRKYPNLIIPILQEVNQYNLGVERLVNFVLPIVSGKYFAMNEGDDYWTDTNKLQKQVDYLEENENCSLVTHKSNRVSENGEFIDKVYTPIESGFYSIEDVLLRHTYFTTNSILLRTSILFDNIEVFKNCPSFDYMIKTIAAFSGNIYTLSDNMSCYRVASNGSWTSRMAKDKYKHIKHIRISINTYKYIDKHFNNEYHEEIQKCILQREFNLLLIERKYKMLLTLKYDVQFRTLTFKQRLKIYVGAYFPKFLYIAHRNKGKNHD